MKQDDINAGLAGRLSGAALGYQIVWPNLKPPATLTPPFLTFQVVPSTRTNQPLAGVAVVSSGYLQVNICIALNDDMGDREAVQIADTLRDLFAPQTRITQGTASIVMGDERPAQGFQTDTHWVEPVRIDYTAYD